jgi:hypothetical protein
MSFRTMKTKSTRLFVCALSLLVLSPLSLKAGDPPPPAEFIAPPESEWKFELVPYAWAGSLEGRLGYQGFVSDVDISVRDTLDNLDFAGMGAFGVEYGKFGLIVDGLYSKTSASAPLSSDVGNVLFKRAEIGSEAFLGEALITYRFIDKPNGYRMSGYTGVRANYLKTELTLPAALAPKTLSGSRSDTWWDGVVGVRGNIPLGERWFARYKAGIGTGDSDLIWDLQGVIGYRFTEHFDLRGGYRYFSVDYEKGDQDFVFDADVGGFIFGLGFSW